MARLESLRFDNHYARLAGNFATRLDATPFENPFLVTANPSAMALLELDISETQRTEWVEIFGGKLRLDGSEPLASVYAGHQFGVYVPQLGDGRALLLGEVVNSKGEKWDVQLKGSGRTPYSRFGDGRAVLRSTIREYLCSEAMYGLNIPTTRALTIIGSDEEVMREDIEKAAILTRLAPSHIRFGHFEFFYYSQQDESVRTLADFVMSQHFPEFALVDEKYALFFEEVVVRTARLIAAWQSCGFAHGVMNTDNMSILGLTLDYGPFGFMEAYDPGFIPNHSDHGGRYAFDQQPTVALWNLHAFAQSLAPVLVMEEAAAILQLFQPVLVQEYAARMRAKLGLSRAMPGDSQLVQDLLDLMAEERVDYTRTFRALSHYSPRDKASAFEGGFNNKPALRAWLGRYRERLVAEGSHDQSRHASMQRANPKYILRNYMAEQAIQKAVKYDDYTEIERVRELLSRPYDEQPEMEIYASLSPEWANDIVISCSS